MRKRTTSDEPVDVMRTLSSSFLSSSLLVWFSGCVTSVSTPTPAPVVAPSLNIPPGCEQSLAGRWQHAFDSSFRYLATDDGGQLTLSVERVFERDAGFVPRVFRVLDAGVRDAGLADAGPSNTNGADAGSTDDQSSGGAIAQLITIELVRGPDGFKGFTRTTVTRSSGQPCAARFATTVLGCEGTAVRLETERATSLGDGCEPPANPQPVPREEHRLVRLGADAAHLDAGVPDGG